MSIHDLIRIIVHDANPGALKSACDRLFAELSVLAGLDEASPATDEVEPRQLPVGTAIAPRDAARCVQDLARTSAFMRGVRAAVADACQRRNGATVEVLYAGCGPFAALTLPLIVEHDPAAVQLTLIDAHARSLRAARAVCEGLGGLAHVRAFAHADAATYTVDAGRRPDVVVIECMQRALTKEPQVAMTRHLAAQLAPGGVLVPERVAIDACLADVSKEFALDAARPVAHDRIPLARLAELSAGTRAPFPPVVLAVPEASPRYTLHLLTTIHVHGDLVLRDYDSGITFPLLMPAAPDARAIEFRYQEGESPGWHHRLLRRASPTPD